MDLILSNRGQGSNLQQRQNLCSGHMPIVDPWSMEARIHSQRRDSTVDVPPNCWVYPRRSVLITVQAACSFTYLPKQSQNISRQLRLNNRSEDWRWKLRPSVGCPCGTQPISGRTTHRGFSTRHQHRPSATRVRSMGDEPWWLGTADHGSPAPKHQIQIRSQHPKNPLE